MKKRMIAALVAAATLVFGSLTVSADSPTTTTTPAPVATQTVKTETPTAVSAQDSVAKTSASAGYTVKAVETTMVQAAQAAVQDRFLNDLADTGKWLGNNTLVAAATSNETTVKAEAISTVDVDPTTATKGSDGLYEVTLNIAGVQNGDIIAVLHWNGSAWEAFPPTNVSNGSVTFKTGSLSPISVVKFTVSGKITSPKTGEN